MKQLLWCLKKNLLLIKQINFNINVRSGINSEKIQPIIDTLTLKEIYIEYKCSSHINAFGNNVKTGVVQQEL